MISVAEASGVSRAPFSFMMGNSRNSSRAAGGGDGTTVVLPKPSGKDLRAKHLAGANHNSNFTMVYGTYITYNYSIHGVYKPTFTSLVFPT